MKRLLPFSLMIMLVSCGQQAPNLKEEQEKITTVWQDWPTKAKTGKPELMAYYFADSATLMGQEFSLQKGKGAITKFFAAVPKLPSMTVNWGEKPNIIRFSKDGDMAYSLDKQEVSMKDSTGHVQTKVSQAIHVWKKDNDGNWKVDLLLSYPIK